MKARIALLLVVAACRPAGPAEPQVQAAIQRRSDTLRFVAPAVARRCEGGRGLLVEAAHDGRGLLVWLRGVDSGAADSIPVVGMRDTSTVPAANASIRFIADAVGYTVGLDSGAVAVTDSGGWLRLQFTGSGLELTGGSRPTIVATFDPLPPPADSVPCLPVP